MGREIKFREFIKLLKWMLPVERIYFDYKTVEVDLSYGNGDTSEYEFDEVELMQFTGYKENGKDIYEGDIIKVKNDYGDEEYTTTIRYEQGALVVDINGEDYDITAFGWAIDIWDNNGDEWEVVGNIHEKL